MLQQGWGLASAGLSCIRVGKRDVADKEEGQAWLSSGGHCGRAGCLNCHRVLGASGLSTG